MLFNSKSKFGFTVIEILVALSIVALVAGLVFASFGRWRSQQVLHSATTEVLAALNQARVKTLAGEGDARWGVRLATSSVTVFKGTTYNVSEPANRVVTFPGVVIASSTLAGGGVDITYDRLTGKTVQSGLIFLTTSADASLNRTIEVRTNGVSAVK